MLIRGPSDEFRLVPAGLVRSFLCNAEGKPLKLIEEAKNLVTYQGADILAKALTGAAGYFPNSIWVEIQSGGYAAPVPARTDTAASIVAAYSGTQDAVPCQLAAPAGFLSSGANYANNRATFWAFTQASTGSVNSVAVTGANVRGAVLTVNDPSKTFVEDLVFSHVALAQFTVPSGQHVGIEWIVTLT